MSIDDALDKNLLVVEEGRPDEQDSDEVSFYYRPQMKFAKVMFLHVSVCPQWGGGFSRPTPGGGVKGSGGGGVSRQTAGGGGCPGPGLGRGYPSMYWNAFLFKIKMIEI